MSSAIVECRDQPPASLPLGYATMHFSPKLVVDGPSAFEQIDAAAAAGYDWIALDRHTIRLHAERGDLEELAGACAERLPCRELHALVVVDDPAEVAADAERLACTAALLGPTLVLTVVKAPAGDRVLRSLREAIDIVRAAVGSVPFGIECSPLFAIAGIGETRELIARLERSAVGVIVDSWHFFHGGAPWDELERLPLGDLALVHFNDHGPLGARSLQQEKDRRAIPGSGVFDLARFAAAILAKGYDGGVEVEVVSEPLRQMSASGYALATYAASAPYWQRRSVA